MKNLLLLFCFAFISPVFGQNEVQGIQFKNISLDSALVLSKLTGQDIFIDVYTTWCGPCKLMDKRVFSDKQVGDTMNVSFINLRIDAENSDDGLFLSRKFKIVNYPSFLFLDEKGNLIKKYIGYRDVNSFLNTIEIVKKI